MKPVFATSKARHSVSAMLNTGGAEHLPGTAERPARRLQVDEMRRLAEFRFRLRQFLHFSHEAAEESGLRAQQHQLLLTIFGMPQDTEPSIANVAARMLLKHNSTVELVDRAIEQGLLRRVQDPVDQRRILLRLTPHGERLLHSLSAFHLNELERSGPALIRSLKDVLRTGNLKAERRAPRAADSMDERGA